MSVELDGALRFEDERLGHLLGWWRERVEALGHLPGRRHFDPATVKPLLPHLYLVNVLPGGRFHWRLLGTAITEMAGRDSTGRFFDEIYSGAALDNFVRSFAAVVRTGRPMRSFGTFSFTDTARDFVSFEAMEFPLAADGCRVDMVLGIGVATRVEPEDG